MLILPPNSKFYVKLSLLLSSLMHCIVIFLPTKKINIPNKNLTQSVFIFHQENLSSMAISSQFQDFSDQPSVNMESEPNVESSFPLGLMNTVLPAPLPTESEYDNPAILLNNIEPFDLVYSPDETDFNKPLIVIKLWISALGQITKLEIIENQMDEETTKKLTAQIGSQIFYPAMKDGKGVASIKTYYIASEFK